MKRKFHISKHGVPAVCNSPTEACSYGDVSVHFDTYEEAVDHINKINEAVKGNITLPIESPAQKIRSYYSSGTAINEFPLNKKIADLQDFDLIVVSWLAIGQVKEKMKSNQIGIAKFTYGDIVRILEEELKTREGYESGLNLERKYYNPIPYMFWEPQMKAQKNLYRDGLENLADKLNFDSLEIVSLPMEARKRLVEDGYLSNADNLNEVIYKVTPAISQFGNIIAYNHTTERMSKEFDVYEIAGAFEGKTLHDLCYEKNMDARFREIWEANQVESKVTFEEAKERYKREQFFKVLEGTDIPRAFMKMSPIVAKEIATFVSTHRAIMMAIGAIMTDSGVDDESLPPALQEDEEWVIE